MGGDGQRATEVALDDLGYNDLRRVAVGLGLPGKGTKEELLAAIKEKQAQLAGSDAGPADGAGHEPPQAPEPGEERAASSFPVASAVGEEIPVVPSIPVLIRGGKRGRIVAMERSDDVTTKGAGATVYLVAPDKPVMDQDGEASAVRGTFTADELERV